MRGERRGIAMQSTRDDGCPRINFRGGSLIMRAQFFKWPAAALGVAVAIFAGAGASRAQYGQSSAPPAQPPSQSAPPPKDSGKPPKINKAEEAAYKNVLA